MKMQEKEGVRSNNKKPRNTRVAGSKKNMDERSGADIGSRISKKIIIYFNPMCPYCHQALGFINDELSDVPVKKIELGQGLDANLKCFAKALSDCHCASRGIPLIIIGDKCFQGFDAQIGTQIKKLCK